MSRKPSAEAVAYLENYLKERAAEGGRAVVKKYGREHMAALRIGKGRYGQCPNPSPKDAYKRHHFNKITGVCCGCKKSRKELAI